MVLTFEIKVVPSSGRVAWAYDKNGTLKCFLSSPPEKGKANKELIKLIAKVLNVPQLSVAIVSGATTRNKRIEVETLATFDQFVTALGLEKQLGLFAKK
jgi:uncharacterized protein (TIGR00251 family)